MTPKCRDEKRVYNVFCRNKYMWLQHIPANDFDMDFMSLFAY